MQIVVLKEFWEKESVEITFLDLKYYILKYPLNNEYEDYICKINSDFVTVNKDFNIIEVWDEFVFDFEKKEKIPGKRFKHVKILAKDIVEMYDNPLEQMEYAAATYPIYNYYGGRAHVDSYKFEVFKTNRIWLYSIDDHSDKKKCKAKNTTIIKYLSVDEYENYKIAHDKLVAHQEYVEDLKNELKSWDDRLKLGISRKASLIKYYNRAVQIRNDIKKEIEDLKKDTIVRKLNRELFNLIYGIDIDNMKCTLCSLNYDDEHCYEIRDWDFPFTILNNGHKVTFEKLVIPSGWVRYGYIEPKKKERDHKNVKEKL